MTQHRFDELREFLTFCEMDFHEGKLTRNLDDTCNRMANLLFGTKGKAAICGRRNGSEKKRKDMETRKLLLKAIEHFGVQHQTTKAIEEMAELICELTRAQDDRTTEDKIREEIADAWITLQQQMFIHGESEVMNYVKQKLERLEERINGGN